MEFLSSTPSIRFLSDVYLLDTKIAEQDTRSSEQELGTVTSSGELTTAANQLVTQMLSMKTTICELLGDALKMQQRMPHAQEIEDDAGALGLARMFAVHVASIPVEVSKASLELVCGSRPQGRC